VELWCITVRAVWTPAVLVAGVVHELRVSCSRSAPDLIAEVAADLPFAPVVQGLADKIYEKMTLEGAAFFNSLHLRIEADAKDWMDIIGGSKVTLPFQLVQACVSPCHQPYR